MRRTGVVLAAVLVACLNGQASGSEPDTGGAVDLRMQWWRGARFGMFIHWGLYAVPAGQWGERTDYGEWIMHAAQIPIQQYEQLQKQFNPTAFDADRWVRSAKNAGMKYIVITTKHHDGFCLFDSEQTDYDVMSTPFQRDIMKELVDACQRHGLRIGWYYSIMDWHHPDYLPRRPWEERSAENADYERYVTYLKEQVRELLTLYGPIDVLWFDGQWEDTWTHERGLELYKFARSLQPNIIINNRVDKGPGDETGSGFAGDFGTPEQRVPATGLPGVDWESCMTMNRNWGYNKHDKEFKSAAELIRMLTDITSKGGNLLLNVGPEADGQFPPPCEQRLAEIGAWLRSNGESIYGTQASPLTQTPWGRCTQKALETGDTRLYLHIFEWPADARLVVPNLLNQIRQAYLLQDANRTGLEVSRSDAAVVIRLPPIPPDAVNTVVVLDIAGRPDVGQPPTITAEYSMFLESINVSISSTQPEVEIRFTTDGSEPQANSTLAEGPLQLTATTTVAARAFRGSRPVSNTSRAVFVKVRPRQPAKLTYKAPGLVYDYFEGEWDKLPDFDALVPLRRGVVYDFDFSPRINAERFGFRYTGFVNIPRDGVYTFYTTSDDGSQLRIGSRVVVDNDGLHGTRERQGVIALAAGLHPICVTYFEKTGGDVLDVSYAGPGIVKQTIPSAALMHDAAADTPAVGPTPSARQLSWQRVEMAAFIHFGINTFTDREWGDGQEQPALFNPTAFDARQWVEICKQAGLKKIILTAKHHDGFCLWPSKYTEHSVRNSPWRGGKGDVVREVAEACREAGLQFGIYLSPWDRHEPCYGNSRRYNTFYKNQLAELLTQYGPVHEVWFDGACGEGPNGKKQVYDWAGYVQIIRRLQPQAVIFSDAGPDVRWIGNEHGLAGPTNWSMLHRERYFPGTPDYHELTAGHIDGEYWVPAECNVSIRPGWFYHPAEDNKVKSVENLVDIYYKSVGRNSVLLLNIPPDTRGLIHETDVARLTAFGKVIAGTFDSNLALHKQAEATSVRSPLSMYAATMALDGDLQTYWTTDANLRSGSVEIDLGSPIVFDCIMIQEAIERGQRVKSFAVDAWDGTNWQHVADGTTIGYKRLLRISEVRAERVRLVIRDARASPAISEFGLYKTAGMTLHGNE